ncbi:RAB6-interacting golgin isoform X2 [Bos javanicus]|uniref:RAB6-interacting golgin isoform X2 n=1 Tax=Bos javanicus TaxID=9906 RepID=UPI002AA90CB9|nr:RAB6-interacting golgin isoform X2 [Bos javanicus]
MCLGSRVGSRGSEVWGTRRAGKPRRMAQGWAGFSEEELRRLKQTKDPFEPQRRLPGKKSRQQLQRERALQEQSQKFGLQDGPTSLPPEQLLSAPKQRFNTQRPYSSPPTPLILTSPVGDGKPQGTESQQKELGLKNSHEVHKNAEVLPLKADCQLEKKKVELSKRTQAETMKLKRIQKELQALDDMVSADIGILRNRIDQASLDYSYARKRFDRAEAEYVTAKLELQRKTELKEQLTEHLCTIIQQNELRKAKKLEELMQQLDVHADEETLELEVEVERLLCEQEAEARKQVVHLERSFQPSGESVTLELAKENKKPQDQAASPKVDEQGKNSNSIALLDPERPNEEVETAVKDISASLIT